VISTRRSSRSVGIAATVALWVLALAREPTRPVALAAIAGTVGLLYLPTLHYGFVNEDFDFGRPWSLKEMVATFAGSWDPRGILEDYYRPLVSLSLAGDYWLWSGRPAGFHLTNLLIHCASGILAYRLLGRLGLSPRGALLGALVWVAHPLSASAASWCNQRTDGLTTFFYLAALFVLTRSAFTRAHALAVAGLALLALASKETAITLPVVAYLLIRFARLDRDRPQRKLAVGLLALIAVAYLGFWLSLFPGKLSLRAGRAETWEGFDLRSAEAGEWLRLLPALYTPVFLPTDYPRWWSTSLAAWPPLYLAAGMLATPAILLVLARRKERQLAGVVWVGLLWPLVTIAPYLGSNTVDLFRFGLLVALGSGLVFGSFFSFLARHASRLSLIPVAILALLLAPRAIASAAVWGPGGRYYSLLPNWRSHLGARGWDSLTPEMQQLFQDEVSRDAHRHLPLSDP
jgi:hypothetical protein